MADLRFPGRSEMLGTLAAAENVDVHQLLEKLKASVFKSRLRLREFFKDFDTLRTGIVTAAKFRTALDESGLKLSDPEFAVLTSHFADPADPKRVRFEDMLDQIDSVFNTAGMETDPASTVTDFTPHLTRPIPKLASDDSVAYDALLAKLQHIVKVRQLLIKPVFSDYSKNVNSTLLVDQVTTAQFRNGLSQLGLQLTAEEAALLCARFAGAAPGYVDYVAFCCAVDAAERTFSMREPRSYVEQPLASGFRAPVYHPDVHERSQPGRPPVSNNQPKLPVEYPTNPKLTALIAKLQQKAMQHRLRVADFFIEFDKHCDGTVTQPQFIKRLSVAYDKVGLGLSEDEVQLLLDSYGKPMRHGATHVMWRQFVGDIDKVFTTVGMEKDPALTPVYSNTSQEPVTLPPAREAAVQRLLADLRKRVEVRRVLVKPLFSDYGDWSHSTKIIDHITRQQVVQSLSRFGIELPASDQQLIFDRYDTLGLGTVNHIALVRDIDPYEGFSGRVVSRHVFPQDPDYGGKPTMKSGFWKDRVVDGPLLNLQPGRPPTTNDQPTLVPFGRHPPALQTLLERLQRTAVQHRLRVDECFKDFDRHRDGSITVNQFQSACAMTWGKHLPISQGEAELLVKSYAVNRSGQTHVAWKTFVKDVNTIFLQENLEKTPTVPAPPLVAQLPRPKGALTYAEQVQAEDILARMREHCKVRRVLVKPFFADAEYNRRSMRVVDHITKSQFAQVLSRLSLHVTNDEVALLSKKFDDKGDGFVNYVAFSCAVDVEEQASDRDSAPRFPMDTFRANGNFKATKTSVVQPGRAPPLANVPDLLSSRRSLGALGPLMRRLQEKVIQFKIPIQDFFVDYDTHKIGAISPAQFRRGMNFAFGDSYIKESITADEMALLETVYAREMLDGALFVGWKEFTKDINAAILTPNLEVQPSTVPAPVVPELGHTAITLPPDQEARVQEILSAMRERFRIRAVYVKAPFHDFAQSNNSPMMVDHVTRQQFVQGLSKLGVEPSAQDLELLFCKYDHAGDCSVNYVAFATDVDSTETFSTRERMPHSPVANTAFYGGFRKMKVHEDLLRSM